MAKLYVSLIHKGIRTIDMVPKIIRADVQALLDAEKEKEQLD